MKDILRKIFSPLLSYFEAGESDYSYRNSHRTVLVIVGILFLLLTAALAFAGFYFSQIAAVAPGFIFGCVGITCLIVSSLGTNRAIAKIWGNR
ncbi:MAG: O-antigen/teichoic acid export membrane protein [Cellvibrionaceae bacterium]|jgi:O-antigen/teichoic acid export membrane protein